MYKCIKGFLVSKCDDDGFILDNEDFEVEEGSVWYIPEDEDYRLIDGEVRLENNDFSWIEIPRESLEEHFEKVQ